ncbi:MAG: hypothetical protein HPY74_10195 [Firmicutes bacterium]|nr:hypothetical protein [Bacillota bacterium]
MQSAQQLLDLLSEYKYPRLVQVPSKDGNTNLVYIYPIYHVSRYSKDKDTYLINIISHDAFIKRINDIIGEIQPGGGVYIFEKGSGEMRFKYTQDNEMYQLAADALKGKLTHKDKGIYIITSEQTGLDFVMLVSHEEIMAQIRKYNMSNNFILRYYSGRYMP